MKTVLVCILFVVLTFAGMYFFQYFFHWCTSLIQSEENHISIQSTTMSGQFTRTFLFAISIGLMPVYYALIRVFTKRPKFKDAFLIFSFMIVSAIFAVYFRAATMKAQITEIERYTNEMVPNIISLDQLKFSHSLFFGVLFGALMSFVLFTWGFRSKALQTKPDVEL